MISEHRFRVYVPASWPGRERLFAAPRPASILRDWAEAGLAVVKDRALRGVGVEPIVLGDRVAECDLLRVRVSTMTPLAQSLTAADDPAKAMLRLAYVGMTALHAEVDAVAPTVSATAVPATQAAPAMPAAPVVSTPVVAAANELEDDPLALNVDVDMHFLI